MKVFKPYIYIRADGSQHIGLGHLVRCMALSQMLKNVFDITFFCKEIPESMENELNRNDFPLIKIFDEEQFLGHLFDKIIVILDGYSFDTKFQKKIKNKGCKLVCIDDLHDKEYVADLIINHAPGIVVDDYKALISTQFALGLEYALLRPSFLKQTNTTRIIKKVENVMICFGGSDMQNITLKVLRCTLRNLKIKEIHVVCGSEYVYNEQLKEIAKVNHHLFLYSNLNAEELANLMNHCQLAILPSSTIAIEAMISNMLLLTGITAHNQQYIEYGLSTYENVKIVGDFSEIDDNVIEQNIDFYMNNFKEYKVSLNSNSKEKLLNIFQKL